MAASLFFTSLGLWFYLGAAKNGIAKDENQAQESNESYNSIYQISAKHIALGSLFISLNLGCRPTFIIAFLLAIPLFYNNIYFYFKHLISSKKIIKEDLKQIIKLVLSVIVPFVIVAIPIGLYNALRFGSPFNFGNEYQITITDMTTMRLPVQNIIPSILSYLALPLRFTPVFPWISINPIAFNRWQYAEPMIGGMFTLAPLAFIGVICSLLMIKKMSKFASRLTICALILAMIVVVFNSLKAGIGWRYIADFGWAFSLSAIIGITVFLEKYANVEDCTTLRTKVMCYTIRIAVLAMLFFSIAIAFLGWFVPGREDSVLRFNPGLWHYVRCWFTLI